MRRITMSAVAAAAALTLALTPSGFADEAEPAEVVEPTLVRHIHTSGHSFSDAAQSEVDVDWLMGRTDIVTTTEVTRRVKARVMNEPGWQRIWYSVPGYNENAISVRKSVWSVEETDGRVLSPQTYKRLNGSLARPVTATTALLIHQVTGERLLVSVAHLPSVVEGKKGLLRDDPARAKTYRKALRGWKKQTQAWVDRAQPDGVIVVADWNLDVKKKWVRKFLRKRTIAGSKPSFAPKFPRRGTVQGGRIKGRRLVDFAMVTGLARERPSKILKDIKSSDHHPVEHVWRFAH